MSVRVSKDALRKEMKKVLNSLTTREKMDQSEAVTKTVCTISINQSIEFIPKQNKQININKISLIIIMHW